jgi:hypothetical protein
MSAANIDSKIALDLRIPVNLTNTSAPGEKLLVRLYDAALSRYGQPITYQLIQQAEEAYLLQAWHKQEIIQPPIKTFLPLVIKTDSSLNKTTLHIGSGKHYFIASKADFVDFAADIVFLEDGTIDYFNDRSGAYVVPDKFYLEIKTASFIAAIKMGLPMHKFRMHYASENAKKALFIALTTTGMQEKSALALVLTASKITIMENALQLVNTGAVTATNFASFTLSAADSSITTTTVSKTKLDAVPPTPTTTSAVNSPQLTAILAVPAATIAPPPLMATPILIAPTTNTHSSKLQQLVTGNVTLAGYAGGGLVMPLPNTAAPIDAFTATVLTAPAAATSVPTPAGPLIFRPTAVTGINANSIPTIPTGTTNQDSAPKGCCDCSIM